MDTPDTTTIDPPQSESWTKFAAWSAEQLGCALSFDGETYRLVPDQYKEAGGEDQASVSTIRRRWSLRRSKQNSEEPRPLLEVATEEDLLNGLISLINEKPNPPSLRPKGQPQAVHELTDSLFAAYQLDGGKLRVAGCRLEDVPFFRMTTLAENANAESTTLVHRYFDTAGNIVSDSLINDLGLDQVEAYDDATPRLDEKLVAQGKQLSEQENEGVISLVWARRASGLLRFEFGEESVDVEFSGWAKTLVAPAVVCPQTGVETFHLSTTDDGQIVAAEQIACCQVSGKRYTSETLETCSETRKRVAPDLLTTFAFNNKKVLKSCLHPCDCCHILIPASKKTRSGCRVCDSAKPNSDSKSQAAELLADYPKLAKQKWSITEYDGKTILVNEGWFRRRIAVVENQSKRVVYLAESSRLSNVWRPIVNHDHGEQAPVEGEDA